MTLPDSTQLAPSPAAPAPIVPKARQRAGGSALLVIAVLVAVAGVMFAVGRLTAPATASSRFTGANGNPFPNASGVPGGNLGGNLGGTGGGSMAIEGTVVSTDGTTMTVKLSSGTTVTVNLDGTTYHSQAGASATDVTAGSQVQVLASVGAGAPGASTGPAASGAPASGSGAGAGRTMTATDVTIVSK